MSDNLLTSKIELLEEQIENIERSGFFTEVEIDRASKSLKAELATLQHTFSYSQLGKNAETAEQSIQQAGEALYGMTAATYAEGIRFHNECFEQIKNSNSLNFTNAKTSNEFSK